MYKLKKINRKAIPKALEKVDRYRLLNEPIEAESICRDILIIEPDNQEALVRLVLTLSDQLDSGASGREALELAVQLKDKYSQVYYKGIVLERLGKTAISKGLISYDAYEWIEDAMEQFEKAEKLSPDDNNDAILRWNACVRIIQKYHLKKRPPERSDRLHLPLE